MLETNESLRRLGFENSNLFRLPARSPASRSLAEGRRSGEGRDFDIRISNYFNIQSYLVSATPV
jgi:hypothetical protein